MIFIWRLRNLREVFIEKEDSSFLELNKWSKDHEDLKVGFTTRLGGISNEPYNTFNHGFHVDDLYENVVRNREILADKLNFPLESWVFSEQTHKTNIKIIQHRDKGKGATSLENRIKDTDGFITKEKGVLCTALFADCAPLFFFDPITKYIGIAHAGWQGTVNNIAKEMVYALTKLGVNPNTLLVAIGPCISQENYEVDSSVIKHVEKSVYKNTIISTGENRFLLDLKQLNVENLLQSGILRNNIDITNYCTYNEEDLFFSHRRDVGGTGRMLGYIGYKNI